MARVNEVDAHPLCFFLVGLEGLVQTLVEAEVVHAVVKVGDAREPVRLVLCGVLGRAQEGVRLQQRVGGVGHPRRVFGPVAVGFLRT